MVTLQDQLRCMAGIHPGLNEHARKLLNESADALDRLERREENLLRQVQVINPLAR